VRDGPWANRIKLFGVNLLLLFCKLDIFIAPIKIIIVIKKASLHKVL